MSFQNILLLIIVIVGAIALLMLLISRNKKDKKEFEAGVEDVMEETKTDHQRNTEKL
jgi:FtsZ-interacting cell division protein ZipA